MRPAVVALFYKNGHRYRKDYGIEAHTLGDQIMQWWSEISPPGGVPSVRFGGPTGIYSLVVSVSWWCTLLKSRPSREHTDCLRTLTDIDRALLEAITKSSDHPAASSSTSPPPPSQPRKRTNSGEMPAPKRKRSGQV